MASVAGTTWIENSPGVRAFEESDPGLNAAIEALAARARDYARSIAPVGSPADDDHHVGAYRDSIDIARNPDLPGWEFYAADNKAHWIEYGAAHMPKFGVLTRAVEHIR